jgi:hypothetical protein
MARNELNSVAITAISQPSLYHKASLRFRLLSDSQFPLRCRKRFSSESRRNFSGNTRHAAHFSSRMWARNLSAAPRRMRVANKEALKCWRTRQEESRAVISCEPN